jgi:hypothetical protein
MTDEKNVAAMRSLIQVLTSALRIVRQTHYADPPMPEFTPEKTRRVVETALKAAALGENL